MVSPQTALIFVGLPLVTALVLLATPLHDAAPPPLREDAAALTAEATASEPRLAAAAIGTPAPLDAVVRRKTRRDAGVPAVIYETRRVRYRGPATARADSESARVVMAPRASDTRPRPAAIPEPITLASATETPASHASPIPQSP